MPNCFKCDKSIGPAACGVDPWKIPDGVLFEGGWNYGSRHYDAAFNGLHVEIVICDDCIESAKGTLRMREVQGISPVGDVAIQDL